MLPKTKLESFRDWVIREHAKVEPECAGPLNELRPTTTENRVKVTVRCEGCLTNFWNNVWMHEPRAPTPATNGRRFATDHPPTRGIVDAEWYPRSAC